MNDRRVWDAVIHELAPRRQIMVAPTDTHDSIEAIAAAALALAPPGRFAVAGFSLGGYVALELWRQAPARIAGMALLDTGARADSDASRQVRQRMIDGVAGGQADFGALAAAFLPRIVHPSRVADAHLARLLADMARTVGSAGFVRQQRAAMLNPDHVGDLASIRCPTLVLCGREDQVTPPELSEEMADAIPDAQLVIVPDCGHMSPLEQPDAVVQALSVWCDRVDASAR